MSDANQVRINELARELEVKAKAIIDLLPGFGVTEKKTHSSSIPADVAEKVKDHLKGVADAETAAEADRSAKEAAAKAALRRPPAPVAAPAAPPVAPAHPPGAAKQPEEQRTEEHTSELQSRQYLVCRLLLVKKKKNTTKYICLYT